MNILQVVPELNAGGVERTTIEIAQALHANGHVPHVASAGGRLEDELRAAGGVLHRLRVGSKNPMTLRRNTKDLIDIIKANKIDIVHARSRAPAWPARAAAKATNVPFVTTYHGIYNAQSGLKRRYNSIMAKADVVIANSQYTKKHIMAEHGTDEDNIVVIPRGVDMRLFDPTQVSTEQITDMRGKWGVADGDKIILLPGRLTRWKGQLVAVEAMKILSDMGNDLFSETKLVLLGDAQGRDDYVTEIQTKAEVLGVADRVILASHTRAMPCALRTADVVISTSTDPEAFGRVMAEAQAMERLVVASNHGGARETVVDGQGGYLVEPNNAEDLAQGISKILKLSSEDYQKRAQNARTRIGEHYSATALKTATLAVYDKILTASRDK